MIEREEKEKKALLFKQTVSKRYWAQYSRSEQVKIEMQGDSQDGFFAVWFRDVFIFDILIEVAVILSTAIVIGVFDNSVLLYFSTW